MNRLSDVAYFQQRRDMAMADGRGRVGLEGSGGYVVLWSEPAEKAQDCRRDGMLFLPSGAKVAKSAGNGQASLQGISTAPLSTTTSSTTGPSTSSCGRPPSKPLPSATLPRLTKAFARLEWYFLKRSAEAFDQPMRKHAGEQPKGHVSGGSLTRWSFATLDAWQHSRYHVLHTTGATGFDMVRLK